jgi:cell wall-associated NlpC family hydrolase
MAISPAGPAGYNQIANVLAKLNSDTQSGAPSRLFDTLLADAREQAKTPLSGPAAAPLNTNHTHAHVRPVQTDEVRGAIDQKAMQGSAANQPTSQDMTPKEEALLHAVAAVLAKAHAKSGPAQANSDGPLAVGRKALSLDDPPGQVARSVRETAENLAKTAASQLGKPYAAGGASPGSGFDCSGFTHWVCAKNGLDLARNSHGQFQEGKPVAEEDLQKGDLVFFGSKHGVRHVGMYLGNGQFIHAASSNGKVKISSLDSPLWSKLYLGARRVT